MLKTASIFVEHEVTQAEQEIAAAWRNCQKAERTGIEFGRICYEWREKFGAKGKRIKGMGVTAIWQKLNIPERSAYRWIEAYEESAGIREPKEIKEDSVHYSSNSAEWYTPPEIIERVVSALGSIDVDPCCNPGKPTVPAKTVYREADNGLEREWRGRVYMNPPYGDAIGEWAEKLVNEYARGITTEAIALIPARVDTQWFDLFHEFAVCFIHGRLKFSGSDNSAPFPSAIVYLGPNRDAFYSAFDDLGRIKVPREWLLGK